MQTMLTASTPDGETHAPLLVPDGAGPFPLVVFFVDAGGLRPAMVEMGGHLTRAGYAVVIPDPYWRQGPFEPFDAQTVFGDPDERARLFAMVEAMKTHEWISDAEALIARIEDPRITHEKVGLVGYCMGGRGAFIAATRLGARVAATACVHPGGLVKDADDSPHHRAAEIAGGVYLAVPKEDRSFDDAARATLRMTLEDAGVAYQLEEFEGVAHGFAVPDFAVYDEAAAERSWKRLLELFDAAVVGE